MHLDTYVLYQIYYILMLEINLLCLGITWSMGILVFFLGVQFTERHLEYLQLFETEEMANYLRHKKSQHKDSSESKLQKR